MKRAKAWLPPGLIAALAAGLFLIPTPTRAGDIGYVEDFALARDRAAALKQLVPGTEDYYYYHALHALNTGKHDEAKALTGPWIGRHGQTARVTEIQLRHALLTYDKNPKDSRDFLISHLGLRFDHQRDTVGAAPNLPTGLDQRLISRAQLLGNLVSWNSLSHVEDGALDWVAGEKMEWTTRRELLQRLKRPDLPNLVDLVHQDMSAKDFGGFGAYPVHATMTVPQLDELRKLRPDVLNNDNYVRTYVSKLCPGADSDWQRDKGVMKAYLDRLWDFVGKLPPVHNALKAHVLFHRLTLDRTLGVADKKRFLAYLELPRHQPYMSAEWLRAEAQRWPAHLNVDYSAATLLPAPNADEELVRHYLKHFLADAADTADFDATFNSDWLAHLFAETKVENGVGDPETWASKLPPARFAALKERVDIDFAFTNTTDFAADEKVRLELFLKNTPNLLVKVFEVNATNFYRSQLREVNTDINLDGLVANAEQNHKGDANPFRRASKTFEFPELTKPGLYVVDFIGSGKSSRALVRKGRLKPIVSTGTGGQHVTVVDEANKLVPDAVVWLGGQEYRCNKDGRATIPFTAQPGRKPVVISRGDFSCFDTIDHQPENYRFVAGIHVDRESLLAQRPTNLLVRPALFINDKPVSVKVLEEVRLRITAVDHSGIATSTEVPDFKVFEDRESTYEFRTPSRLRSLNVTLTAKVKSLSQLKHVDVGASETFALNEIDHYDKVEDLHLAKFGPNFVLELLGRTGEAKPDKAVTVQLKHRDFRNPVFATLKTDPNGRVGLGPLADIVSIEVTGPDNNKHRWTLPLDRHTYRGTLHAKAGETVSVPYLGHADKPTRGEFALLEVRGAVTVADKFDALAIKDGLVEARDLPAGDYDLHVKTSGEKVRIRITDGGAVGGNLVGKLRMLEVPGLKPTQIAGVVAEENFIVVKLKDANAFSRVHVFASRYVPAYSAFNNFGKVRDAELGGVVPTRPESVYLTGRNIGDEYRYVLDRRAMRKFPGNMLERPQLLLNPWAIRSTETSEQLAQAGDQFRPKEMAKETFNFVGKSIAPPGRPTAGADWANLDFLADPSAQILNLEADKDGFVKIDRKKIGPHNVVQVVAIDPLSTTVRTVSLNEQKADFVDLRLRDGLDPAAHFAQQKQVSVLEVGKPFVIADAAASRYEAYDSLPKVYTLFATLSKDPKLAEFSFILTWHKTKDEEKRALYSKFACHELNFFLFKRDRVFFDATVKPYLANKKDKTFLDRWLIGEDVSAFTDPWRHARLNTVERVLLSKRMPGEPDRTARHLSDLFSLLPPNVNRDLTLFETAVQSGQMDAKEGGKPGDPRSRAPVLFNRGETATAGVTASSMPALGGAMPPGSGGGGFAGGGAPGAPGMGMPPPAPTTAAPPADRATLGDEAKKQLGALREAESKNGKGDAKDMAYGFNAPGNGEATYFDNDRAAGIVRQLYRKLDPTMEWAENNYYKLRIAEQTGTLVKVNPFWVDYAKHAGDGAFLSRHLAEASTNFTEMMFALAVLDLPFEAGKHKVAFDGNKMTMEAASPVIAFHEEVRPTAAPDGKVPVLVGQNFFRPTDRFREENGEKLDKYVTGEFVVHTVYGSQVVVTNPTSTRQRLNVLFQLPTGAIPVANSQFTKSVPVELEPYRTQTIDYHFYFPRSGKFAHYPAHVSKGEKLVAVGPTANIEVLDKPRTVDTTAWDHVSQFGTDDEVLAYLNRENVSALKLDRVAFRMKDKAVFERVTSLLRLRHVYDPVLWSYGLFHGEAAVAKEFLTHQDNLVAQCGGPIDTPLLTINPVDRHTYEHLEYKPLVNARAHALGNRRQIVNGAFHDQYHKLLKTLTYSAALNDADLLATTYYLLLQDRFEEAQAAFGRVNPELVPTRIQYDYCAAYLAMLEENPAKARSIAAKYAGHQVDRWKNAFAAVMNHADEATGKGPRVADVDDKAQNQGHLAVTEPTFEAAVAGKNVNLSWANLDAVTISYIPMDVELLFSRTPFAQAANGQFAFTKPAFSQVVKMPAGKDKVSIPLPDDLQKRNMLVEVTGAGKTRVATYFATDMDVKFTENFGQVRATDAVDGKPLSKVYVKVYARLADGSVKFHKDGYTDLRGRFDYASVNTPERQAIQKFSVLVLSETKGAVIREAATPQQ